MDMAGCSRGRQEPHHVVVMLYDGIQVLDVTGPVDAFASANTFGGEHCGLIRWCTSYRGRW